MTEERAKAIAKSIEPGVRFLDEKLGPGWQQKIDCDGLDLQDGFCCVLGQLDMRQAFDHLPEFQSSLDRHRTYRGYVPVVHRLRLDEEEAERMGFLRKSDRYDRLNRIWKRFLGCGSHVGNREGGE